MKKIVLATLGVSLLLASTSCKKDILDENPQSILVPSFLGTSQGVESGLAGVYSGMRGIYGNEEAMFALGHGTDEFMRGIQTVSGLDDYNPALVTPTQSGATADLWSNCYRYINDANGVIQYAATVSGIAPSRVTQIIAEAKFLRAQYYFILVQEFGDVPLSLAFVSSPTKDIVRAPTASVYTAILADLTDAMNTIANTPGQLGATASTGRVAKAGVLHLLAKVYLTRATSTAKASDDYTNAAKYAQQLIDTQSTYGAGLETTPATVHAEGNENGKEVLFNVQYGLDATFTSNTQTNNGNVSSYMYRSRYDKLPNMVRDIPNGRPYARFNPTPYLLNLFVMSGESGKTLRTTDVRYNSWFKTVWYVNSPGNNTTAAKTLALGDTAAWYPGYELANAAAKRYYVITPSQYTTEYFPVLNKYDDVLRAATNNSSPRPFIVYRLAETYLIAAEAYYYLNNPALAVKNINIVRERAAATGKKAVMDITASQLSLDFILDERSRELAGEEMRWLDLVRTGQLLTRVKADVPAYVSVLTGPTGTYGSNAAINIQPYHVLRPIPQTEVDRTTGQPGGGIKQNPGY